MAMRDDMKIAIEAGGATKESLLELTGTTEKGLASQFTYMRMMGNCPMKQKDGTFKIVTTEEWEAHKIASGSKSSKSFTPEERVKRGEKRSKRAASAYDSAKKRMEADPDNRLNELKFIKVKAELEIAEIELGKAETAFAESTSDQDSVSMVDPNDEDGLEDSLEDGLEDGDEFGDEDELENELNFD